MVDSNYRPQGYEPCELTTAPIRYIFRRARTFFGRVTMPHSHPRLIFYTYPANNFCSSSSDKSPSRYIIQKSNLLSSIIYFYLLYTIIINKQYSIIASINKIAPTPFLNFLVIYLFIFFNPLPIFLKRIVVRSVFIP